MKLSTTRPISGARDFLPKDMLFKKWLFQIWDTVSKNHGFLEYDAPILEYAELYTIKHGNSDILDEMFSFNFDSKVLALRPEMTPSLARMMIDYLPTEVLPAKLYSKPQCWRNENLSRGRKREFYQWNVDIFGCTDVKSEIDLFLIIIDFFNKLLIGSQHIVIKISDKRILQDFFNSLGFECETTSQIFKIIDKAGKTTKPDLVQKLVEIGLNSDSTEKLIQLISCNSLSELEHNPIVSNNIAVVQLKTLFDYLDMLGLKGWVELDLKIVRGLNYYTGLVFEVFSRDGQLKRAICGGGRYDNMMLDYGYAETIPTIGFGLGDVVIYELLFDLNLLPQEQIEFDYVLIPFDDSFYLDAVKLAQQIRNKNKSVLIHNFEIGAKQIVKRGFTYANKNNAKFVILFAPDEFSEGFIMIKDSKLQHVKGYRGSKSKIQDFLDGL